MKLTIIVNFYNMRREAARTLYTLSSKYQQGVSEIDYQVIALDNGSSEPLGTNFVTSFGCNFEYRYIESASCSPASSINDAIASSSTPFVMSIIDGARMISPALIVNSLAAAETYSDAFVFTLGWHLGDKLQNHAILDGYNQQVEDRLLESVDWRINGYRLFDISVLAGSSKNGYYGHLPAESNCFTIPREAYSRIGGFDEKFTSRGGGLVNLDFFKRTLQDELTKPVMLIGEGSFHQFHGGTATNVPPAEHPWSEFAQEYENIRGEPYSAIASANVHYFESPQQRISGGSTAGRTKLAG